MTLDDLKKMERETITPAIAAEVLGMDPRWIRLTARAHPEWLGFPVVVYQSRTKIPRKAFIRYCEGVDL